MPICQVISERTLSLSADAPELSDTARAAFADGGNEVYLSAVSTWEIAVKNALGRLPLPDPVERFVPHERERHAIAPLPLDEAATLVLPRLQAIHADPFDRMLVCQALSGGLTILTPDDKIRRYPVPTLW